MKYKEIEFIDGNARRIYKDYISRVLHTIKGLNSENQLEILLEINSHIYESISSKSSLNKQEVEKLLDVLERLGQPEQFLKPLVARKKLDEATSSFHPLKIAQALILNLGNGISYVVFTFLYLLLFCFLFLIVAKISNPENVGFFYGPGKIFLLGGFKNEDSNFYAPYEQLGDWFIPAMILLTVALYFLLTILLKFKKSIQKKQQ